MFIFSRALRSLCFGPSVMKPLCPSFFPPTPLVSLIGDALRVVPNVVAAEGVVGVLEELEIAGITDKCIGSSLARGSGCSNGISEFLRILFRGEFSGVCSISLKAVKIHQQNIVRSFLHDFCVSITIKKCNVSFKNWQLLNCLRNYLLLWNTMFTVACQ